MQDDTYIFDRFSCADCADRGQLDFDFSMAFQPIVDWGKQQIFGYEALVRGLNQESAGSVISRVNDDNRYLFDQHCRTKAIALAAKLSLDSVLSINFLPNAVYKPERCIRTTLHAAHKYNFPIGNILFEFTESEKIEDSNHIKDIVAYYKEQGFRTALDDFGAGYAGLGLLADFQTHFIKFDMHLIRNIEQSPVRQAILRHCLNLLRELGITPLAEGVETIGELRWLAGQGVSLMQGYLFAKPGFETLPSVDFESLGNQLAQ